MKIKLVLLGYEQDSGRMYASSSDLCALSCCISCKGCKGCRSCMQHCRSCSRVSKKIVIGKSFGFGFDQILRFVTHCQLLFLLYSLTFAKRWRWWKSKDRKWQAGRRFAVRCNQSIVSALSRAHNESDARQWNSCHRQIVGWVFTQCGLSHIK